uniref:Uncharacterized protein n=1 Tax=Schistosoma japonicum TaxID=6182 RepID=C1LFJ3_SCHJA|nr:hypothetical protein [Schistosoma japonicum]
MLTLNRLIFCEDVIITNLRATGLLRKELICVCRLNTAQASSIDTLEGVILRCNVCWQKIIIKTGSSFSQSKLKLR